jgi:hypothetical protein
LRQVCVLGALLALVGPGWSVWPAGRASGAAPTYVTLQLAHSAETLVDLQCRTLPNVITLPQQAARYRAMGIRGVTDTVITWWARQSYANCVAHLPSNHPINVASWDEMASLQATYGWTFVAGSRTWPHLTSVSWGRAKWEICGSLADIRAHGLANGEGEFAFPDDVNTPALESLALSCGFDFGRDYTAGPTLQMALPVPKPYWLLTYSLNGGGCNDPAEPCWKLPTHYRYTNPATLAVRFAVNPGHWKVIQGYNFVVSTFRSSSVSWDCTSPDWRKHWTSGADATEVYCWSDWLAALTQAHGLTWVTPSQMRSYRG